MDMEQELNQPHTKQQLRDAVQGILNGIYTTEQASKKFHIFT